MTETDYFSQEPPDYAEAPSSSEGLDRLRVSPVGTPGGTSSNSTRRDDDSVSVHSAGSQYLMEFATDSLTLTDSVSINTQLKRDFILPASNEKSPYFVSVPVPQAYTNQEGGVDKTKSSSKRAGSKQAPIGDTGAWNGHYVREYPTEILADRFQKWKKILKGLVIYLKEVAYAQEQFARVNDQLKNSVKFSFLTDLEEGTNRIVDPLASSKAQKKPQPTTLAQRKQQAKVGITEDAAPPPVVNDGEQEFKPVQTDDNDNTTAGSGFMRFGTGSVQDIQVILKKYHLSLAHQQYKISKEINSHLIPQLENLRKDLTFKIKEIKDLHGDFKTNIGHQMKLTSQLINKYVASVKLVNAAASPFTSAKPAKKLQPKHDPYLLRLQLEQQLKRQVAEENYLQEAFINLQSSGLQLEKIIYQKVQQTLQRYSTLIDSEVRLVLKNLCQELQYGMISKPPAMEWDNFVSHHPICLLDWKSNDPLPEPRKSSEIIYPQMKSPTSKCLRTGYFLKKPSGASEYTKTYLMLTSNFIHEFKDDSFLNVNRSKGGANSAPVVFQFQPKANHLTGIKQVSYKDKTIAPIASIPLNSCIVTEISENKFVITGEILVSAQPQRRKPVSANTGNMKNAAKTQMKNQMANTSKLYNDSKALAKSPFHKLIKASAVAQQLNYDFYDDPVKKPSTHAAFQGSEPPIPVEPVVRQIKWTLKPDSTYMTEKDKEHFKKWVVDTKNLTKFDNTTDRIRFIESRSIKNEARSKMEQANNKTTTSNGASSISTSVKSRGKRAERPQHIQIKQPSQASLDFMNNRSRISSPSYDERSSYYKGSPNIIKDKQAPPGIAINGTDVNKINGEANAGYFDLPRSVSNPTSPNHRDGQSAHSRSVSLTAHQMGSGSNSRTGSNSGSTPNSNSGSRPASLRNESCELERKDDEASEGINPRHAMKKTRSAGSVPSISTESNERNSVYSRSNNNSSSNLANNTASSRLLAVRKHKKNLSFNNLNSLVFSKKSGYNSHNQLTSGDKSIIENQDMEEETEKPKTTNGIKLNKSIYG